MLYEKKTLATQTYLRALRAGELLVDAVYANMLLQVDDLVEGAAANRAVVHRLKKETG